MTLVATAVPFAVVDRSGRWLSSLRGPTGQPIWGEHADALRFDLLDDAWDAVASFQPDLWKHEGAHVRPWDVAEGYRAFVEPCTWCSLTGRQPENNPYFLEQGFQERVCLSCWGYGKHAIVGLSTVQLSWGGLLDGKPHDAAIHLVRSSLNGAPGPLLCGIDFRAKDGPGYSVGGGCSGPGWENASCPGCVTAARESFPGLPVFGSVGGRELAAALGVVNRSTWDFRRLWREDSNRIRRNRPRPPADREAVHA